MQKPTKSIMQITITSLLILLLSELCLLSPASAADTKHGHHMPNLDSFSLSVADNCQKAWLVHAGDDCLTIATASKIVSVHDSFSLSQILRFIALCCFI